MSRPSSSVPNQCEEEGGSRRAGRLMEAGSCGAIQGANRAKMTNTTTSTTPIAASGLCWAFPATFPAIRRGGEMAAVDMDYFGPTIPQGASDSDESLHNWPGSSRSGGYPDPGCLFLQCFAKVFHQ